MRKPPDADQPDPLEERFTVEVDPDAPPGNLLGPLARLLLSLDKTDPGPEDAAA